MTEEQAILKSDVRGLESNIENVTKSLEWLTRLNKSEIDRYQLSYLLGDIKALETTCQETLASIYIYKLENTPADEDAGYK